MGRNVLVDRLKGYACFLVLFGHVILGIRLAGVNIPLFFHGMEKFLWSFHVALFLFLSGVVYKITGEWKGKKTRLSFILHKLYTLGVPYIVFSIIYVLINSMVSDANTGFSLYDILYIWKTPVAHFWFLYALFFLFCIWAAFSKMLKNWQIMLLILAIGYIAPLFGVGFGGFDIVFYSALAFGMGTFIDFQKLLSPSTWLKCLIVLFHIIISVLLIWFNKIEAPFFKEFMILFGIYSSIMFISLIVTCKPIAKFLDFVNKYSFQIYLLHTIFTAGIRIVLIHLNITNWLIHIIIGTLFGLFIPILAGAIANKVKFLNFFFFPSKSYPLRKAGHSNGKSN